jgi:hypothetical protein
MVDYPERDRQDCAKLEEIGIEGVRIALLTNAHMPLADRGVAWRWLRDQDQEKRQREEALSRRMYIFTVIAAIAGTIAAIASIWALIK